MGIELKGGSLFTEQDGKIEYLGLVSEAPTIELGPVEPEECQYVRPLKLDEVTLNLRLTPGRMSRKRYIKKLMGHGWSRNDAQMAAFLCRALWKTYWWSYIMLNLSGPFIVE